jgi:hypothetical protein
MPTDRALFQLSATQAPILRSFKGSLYPSLLYAFAFGARLVVAHELPANLPFLTFYPAVVLAALYMRSVADGGLDRSGSDNRCALALTPIDGTNFLVFRSIAGFFFIVSAGVAVAPVFYAARVHRRQRLQDEQLLLLNPELKHRIKSLFAITSSICLQR